MGKVDFRVVDRATRNPLAGVSLELRVGGRRVSDSTTDGSGHGVFTLPRGDAESLEVIARKPGYAPMRVTLRGDNILDRTIPPSYTLALSPPLPIGGVVRDESGRPVEGVKVRLSQWTPVLGREQMELAEVAPKTDAQGRWRAEVIPAGFDPGRLQISFEHPAFMTQFETFDSASAQSPGLSSPSRTSW